MLFCMPKFLFFEILLKAVCLLATATGFLPLHPLYAGVLAQVSLPEICNLCAGADRMSILAALGGCVRTVLPRWSPTQNAEGTLHQAGLWTCPEKEEATEGSQNRTCSPRFTYH